MSLNALPYRLITIRRGTIEMPVRFSNLSLNFFELSMAISAPSISSERVKKIKIGQKNTRGRKQLLV